MQTPLAGICGLKPRSRLAIVAVAAATTLSAMQRGRAAKARSCGWGRSASPCCAASRNRRPLAGAVLPSRVLGFFFAVQHPFKAAPMDGQAEVLLQLGLNI